jgi:hypothetical protein
MKRALLVLVAACTADTMDPPWQLAHDRVVAVRAEPPHVAPGEHAMLEALLAHADGPTTIAAPVNASSVRAPGGLFTAVHFVFDHWEIQCPDDAALDPARGELGLPAGAPVPIDVALALPGPLYAKKTVWLGEARANPPPPTVAHGPDLQVGVDYRLQIDVPADFSVRWLTSCGALRDDTSARATHVVDEPCEGEVVVVVRDPLGGTAWQILPVRAD